MMNRGCTNRLRPTTGSSSVSRIYQMASFTLLEIMLVIVLLGMLSGVVGWQIGKCTHRYAFQQEVEEFYNTLKQSQVLCLTFQTDISVHIFRENGVYYYCLSSDEPFADTVFDRQKKQLKDVQKITVNGQPMGKKCVLSLFSQGFIEPRTILGFFPNKESEDQALWCDAQGGSLLSLCHHRPASLKEKAPAFPEEKIVKFHAKKSENDVVVPDAIRK